MWTRRRLNIALLTGATLPCLPQVTRAGVPQDWAGSLRAALQARVAKGQGRFSLISFETGVENKVVVMRAQVALDWPPGHRRRLVEADGPDARAAFARLEQAVFDAFADTGLGAAV